jgi:hypothetical protein
MFDTGFARSRQARISRILGLLVIGVASAWGMCTTNAAGQGAGPSGSDVRAAVGTNPCGPNVLVRDRPVPTDPIRAAFERRSYSAGGAATLHVRADASHLVVQLFVVDGRRSGGRNRMAGRPVTQARAVVLRNGVASVRVPIGSWTSGLYFAKLSGPSRSVGFAPFVVRPRLGDNRVAVILPTNTWQAYNFRDENGDGIGETWYADPRVRTVSLTRPYLDQGVPPHMSLFTRWLARAHLDADYLTDDDLQAVRSGDALARRYNLIVFSGHEEYVTLHAFDIVRRYRDLGGNLAFLSANSLYARVEVRGQRMTCLGHFRDFGRPEASVIGVQYLDWYQRKYASKPYVVRDASAAPWLFRGTGLKNGDRFGFTYGVEIDATTSQSPPGTHVIADLRGIFGPSETAQRTYYETARGAKVFASGAFNFESPQSGVTDRMLRNLWFSLQRP